MRISIAGEGLFQPEQMRAWSQEERRKISRKVFAGMNVSLPQAKAVLRGAITDGLHIRRKSFANVMTGAVQFKNKDRLPMMAFWSRVGWLGAHVDGAAIQGKNRKGVLIPFNVRGASGRIGYRAFQRQIRQLSDQGNLEFRKVGNRVIVFAETAGTGSTLRRHNLRIGADVGGRRRSVEIPVAVLVPRVQLTPKINLAAAADKMQSVVLAAVKRALG